MRPFQTFVVAATLASSVLVPVLGAQSNARQRALFANRDPAKMRGDAPRVAELSERVSVATAEVAAQLMVQRAPG